MLYRYIHVAPVNDPVGTREELELDDEEENGNKNANEKPVK